MHCTSPSKYSSDENLKPLLNYTGREPDDVDSFKITEEIDSHLCFGYFLVHPSWKCLWNDSVVPSEMKFIGMDFSHTATLYTKMRIAERSFPKKVTFILYSLKSQRSFLTHPCRPSPAPSPEVVRAAAPICARIELQAQGLSRQTASFKDQPAVLTGGFITFIVQARWAGSFT